MAQSVAVLAILIGNMRNCVAWAVTTKHGDDLPGKSTEGIPRGPGVSAAWIGFLSFGTLGINIVHTIHTLITWQVLEGLTGKSS